jgi:hypothetical protein
LWIMELFVEQDSVVRKIWGKGDTILFIFAGAAGEFALNKTVDWLYFTGKLPADPLGRLFSTVTYARTIVFAKEEDAFKAIDKMTAIHSPFFAMSRQKVLCLAEDIAACLLQKLSLFSKKILAFPKVSLGSA